MNAKTEMKWNELKDHETSVDASAVYYWKEKEKN